MPLNDYRKRTIAHVHHLSTIRTDADNYTDRYTDEGDLYKSLSYGSPFVSKGLAFSAWLKDMILKDEKILCVGCGEGYELVKYLKDGFDAYGTELHSIKIPYLKNRIIKAQCPDLPFGNDAFDILSCTEVLEHIRQDLTDGFLTECKRVAKRFFFSIATDNDVGYNSHINLHDICWWYKKFTDLKFKIINMQFRPLIAGLIYKEGITVLANKDI